MKNKKLLLISAALVLVIALMAALYAFTRPETTSGEKSVTITVVHKDGSEKVFSCKTDAEYLGSVLLDEAIATGEQGPYGLMIYTADGEEARWEVDQGYWALFIGEEYATTGADAVPVTDGGTYRLVYTIG